MRERSIGAAAEETGVKVTTIRFYEQRGLLPEPPRSDGGRRLYSDADIARLRFVRHARDLGFDMDAIADLLALARHQDDPCANVDLTVARHLQDVRRRILALNTLEGELSRMLAACKGGATADCAVLHSLGDHGACAGPHAEGRAHRPAAT